MILIFEFMILKSTHRAVIKILLPNFSQLFSGVPGGISYYDYEGSSHYEVSTPAFVTTSQTFLFNKGDTIR